MKQRLADFLNALMGFRKFIAWLAVFMVSIILLLKGYMNGSEWTDLMKTAFTAFVAGNGVEYIATTVKDHLSNIRARIDQGAPSTPPPVPQDNP